MKKFNQFLCSFLIISLLFSSIKFSVASIPNNDFEVWKTDTLFEDLDDLFTLNSAYYYQFNGTYNVSKSNDFVNGSHSARMETIASTSGDTLAAAVSNVNLTTFEGGSPITITPDSITGYLKYDIMPGDTAGILVILNLQGTPVGFTEIYITGTQNNFTRFSYPLNPTFLPPGMHPDTVIFAFISSYADMPIPGSNLYVDQVNIQNGTNVLYNNNISNWKYNIYHYPESWWSTDQFSVPFYGFSGVSQTTDSYSGNFAVKISTMYYDGNFAMGLFSNIDLISGNDPNGFPLTDHPYSIKGHYKYLPVNNDSAGIGVLFTKWDPVNNQREEIHFMVQNLPAASQYDSFEVPLNLLSSHDFDTINIFFSASDLFVNETAELGSELYLDNLSLNFDFPPAPPSDMPVLISPSNNSMETDTQMVQFEWQGVSLATHYELVIADNAAFTNVIYSNDSIVTTYHTPQLIFNAATTYYWHVRAKNNDGTGPWSMTWNFTTFMMMMPLPDMTTLVSPDSNAMNINNVSPHFVWMEPANASYYNIEIYEDASLNFMVYIDNFLSDTTHTAQITLDENKTYYWRVQAINQSGDGPWSYVWNFTTKSAMQIPGITTLVSPDSNEMDVNNISPEFEWISADLAEFYYLQLSDDAGMNNIIYEADSISGLNHTAMITLDENSTYYWRVQAFNQAGNGPWSYIWNFTTIDPTGIIKTDKLAADLNIYPNPAFNSLNIEADLRGSRVQNLKITDLAGKVIFEQALKQFEHDNYFQIQLDISYLDNGMYIIMLQTNDSMITNKFLIKDN